MIEMQSTSVYLDIAKFANFKWKNPDVSRTQGLFHVINIFFGSSLGKVPLCEVLSLQDMCECLMLCQRHQESAQFNIVSVFLNIILKHNLKKLFGIFSCCTKTIVKL